MARSDDNFQETDQDDIDLPTNQPLPQDNGRPADPPEEDDDRTLPADYPALDTNIDAHELYDEGRAGAAEVNSTWQDSDDDEPVEQSRP